MTDPSGALEGMVAVAGMPGFSGGLMGCAWEGEGLG